MNTIAKSSRTSQCDRCICKRINVLQVSQNLHTFHTYRIFISNLSGHRNMKVLWKIWTGDRFTSIMTWMCVTLLHERMRQNINRKHFLWSICGIHELNWLLSDMGYEGTYRAKPSDLLFHSLRFIRQGFKKFYLYIREDLHTNDCWKRRDVATDH